MCEYFKSFDFWCLRDKQDTKYVAIIHFTEITIEKSSDNHSLNKKLYSTSRNEYTLKYLTAIEETSIVTFCSDVFGGSISEDVILDKSQFMTFVESGENILMEKESSFINKAKECGVHVDLLCPAKNKEVLDKYEVLVTQITNLPKEFKLISQTVPIDLWPIINEVIYNINMLHNVEFIATE